VRVGDRLYVVADDDHALGVFDLTGSAPGSWVRLFDGELPLRPRERKAAKADLECLCQLPALAAHPHGALLALGSGSRPQRQRAMLLGLDATGGLNGRLQPVDLAALYRPLHAVFDDLNVEGAFIDGASLCLLQRAHRGGGVNACVRLAWPELAAWLEGGMAPAPLPRSVTPFALGELDGVPLGFTDGVALPGGGWVFTAAAEDTTNSVADGACAGSALGRVGPDGGLQWLEPLARRCKAEGVALAGDGVGGAGADADADQAGGVELLLVTDADDRRLPAQLLSARLPGER
jgi:hypothetical protein